MRRSSEGDSAARELNELRLVFANVSGYTKHVGLRDILKLPELEAQIAEGDLRVEDLESIWLEACAVKGGTTALDPGDDGEEKHAQRASWGVCTELPFEGFVHFLRLCEERVLFPKGITLSPETSPRSAQTGRDLVAARHRMLGLLRASLTLHQRGGVSDGEGEDHQKDQNAPLGETLHSTMVRAALEEGLAHHTPETLRELVRTGVYKAPDSETDREEKKASLGRHLSKQRSRDDSTGFPRKNMPGGLALDRPASADQAHYRTAQRPSRRDLSDNGVASGEAHEQHLLAAAKVSGFLKSRPSPEEMRASHIVHTPAEDALRQAEIDATKSMLADMYGTQDDSSLKVGGLNSRGHGHHHRRPSLDELKSSGIYQTPEQLEATGRQHKLAGTFLEHELTRRIDVSELKDRGIYLNRDDEAKQRLERSMRSDQLSKSLRSRPYIEDLMDRGVLESSQLEDTFQELENTGPVITLDDILKCSVINSAVKEGVVSRETLEKSLGRVQKIGGAKGMNFEEFDKFLSTTETNQVEEEPYSLKLWTLMRMRPALDEQNHREGNRRRNALMAKELEQELGKREPLERLANKGIYLDSTAAKGAVERAHLVHTLAHGLANRPDLSELCHTGIYLERTTPLQHSLERHLIGQRISRSLQNPRRPSKQDLVEHGIYIDATPRELQMEHYLAARNLKHALRERETIQDLKDHGLYQPHDGQRAAHEKMLLKALLQRKLTHAFSSEEVARLKQKGVYKAEEHEKLEAERLLVTRQLARLVSERPNPAQLEREHPGLMEASTLALVFEERVMPRSGDKADAEGEEGDAECGVGPEHLVSFEGLMTWPDVQEFLDGEGGDDAKHEMAQHFELCDSDGDGFITFSQFLRWVELCGLNPDDHLQVTDADLDAEYAKLGGENDKGVTLEQAMSSRLVQRWSTSASLDRKELDLLWGGSDLAGSMKRADKFKVFCRHCESRSSVAHEARLADLQAEASQEEAKAKADLRAKLSAKLSARPDLEELKKARIYRAGGLDPATLHLERNLIAISLKERLLARPALEDLEKRGIKPQQGTQTEHEKNSSKLRQALDLTMQHDDAQWRSHPSQLGAGPREEVSALLQKSLSKRISIQELTNKGIYVVDTDASYALLVHQVLRTHRGFVRSCAQLVTAI